MKHIRVEVARSSSTAGAERQHLVHYNGCLTALSMQRIGHLYADLAGRRGNYARDQTKLAAPTGTRT